MASRKPTSTTKNNQTAARSKKTGSSAGNRTKSSTSGKTGTKTAASSQAKRSSSGGKQRTAAASASRRSAAKEIPAKHIPAKNAREQSSVSLMTVTVIGMLFALLFELSNFDIFGKLGGWLKYGQFGLFGVMAYLFPVLVLVSFIMSSFDRNRKRLLLSSVFLFVFLCIFAHLISPLPVDGTSVISCFDSGAVNHQGGGFLGGMIAIGFSLMVSRTGAVIIVILALLVCLYFLFRDPIQDILDYVFYRDVEYEPEAEYEPEVERKSQRERSSSHTPEVVVRTEPVPEVRRRNVYRRKTEQPIYITEDEEGTVIRIFRSRKKHGYEHDITLTRSQNKAQPLRDGTVNAIHGEKMVGVSNELDMMPHNAGGDEMHEITRRNPSRSRNKSVRSASSERNFFRDTRIPPVSEEYEKGIETPEETHMEEPEEPGAVPAKPGRKEAAVTSVTQAAVNRRAREAKPVKERHSAEKPVKTVEKEQHEEPEREPQRTPKVFQPAAFHPETSAYFAPPMELLSRVKGKNKSSEAELEKIAQDLEVILEQFGVNATVTDIQAGPSVTRFELQPEIGTRVNKITSLADDLKLNLGVTEIRIEAPIPGRQAVGIEIPNKNRQTVYMRELLEEPTLINHASKIAFAAGKDISGNVVVADIAKMPHLLVAGTTGSGKSVFLNTILMTILYRAKPSEVGLIIIDPKKVEFGVYAGIPHLMKDVVTDPGQAVSTLRWAVNEMTNRYQRMQLSSVRDFKSYNAKVDKGTVNPAEENPRKMNQIVIIIDELADLMMVAKKEAEALICRLAQLARAAGIHLIIATQRPSVDVVTGLIKANVPARVALLVSSQIDSRTIIDMPGAEKLLGNGDMLFYPTGYVKPVRIQGAFVSDDEIQKTVDYLIQNNKTDYFSAESKEIEQFMNSEQEDASGGKQDASGGSESKYDDCFYEAGKMCIEMGKASSSMLQRRFNLGFNRAARIIDQLEEFGAVGPQNGAKPREILVDAMTFEEMYHAMMEKN